jgi:hypothetical protein
MHKNSPFVKNYDEAFCSSAELSFLPPSIFGHFDLRTSTEKCRLKIYLDLERNDRIQYSFASF